jgi:hypothetical protein
MVLMPRATAPEATPQTGQSEAQPTGPDKKPATANRSAARKRVRHANGARMLTQRT